LDFFIDIIVLAALWP